MKVKVHCYLRALRKQWRLSQPELASLLEGSRNRVSRVERGLVPPNAKEILAYKLIFGSSARVIFPDFYEAIEEQVMQGAYRLHKAVARDTSRVGERKRALTERMLARATGNANERGV
jgi:transcriptional regulator with XRE-family HTH domain